MPNTIFLAEAATYCLHKILPLEVLLCGFRFYAECSVTVMANEPLRQKALQINKCQKQCQDMLGGSAAEEKQLCVDNTEPIHYFKQTHSKTAITFVQCIFGQFNNNINWTPLSKVTSM